MGPSLYDELGEDFFRRLVHGFYEQVKTDDLLGPMYPADDWEGAENRLRWFLVQYWGGPHTFQAERGRPMLRKRHFPFSIGMPEAERWLELMERSFAQFGEEELPVDARAQLWNHMQRVAYMMINRQ
ncbi:globin [Corynebacterium senegalense]|uniref:globin domain-containing protein n=1 Tax=Corynebacterium senegalense TaxID=2080750 RepID=UPI000E2092FF|nr:globin [Corynebacterium senegalense]